MRPPKSLLSTTLVSVQFILEIKKVTILWKTRIKMMHSPEFRTTTVWP